MNQFFVHLLAFLFLLGPMIPGCKQKPPASSQTTEELAPKPNSEQPNAQSLFDGETLSPWEISNFGTGGEVYVSDGEIVLGMGDGCTGITWTDSFPRVNYEVSLEAKRIMGIDFFCGLTFPVQDDFCSFIVGGWAGAVVGLSNIDNLDASENETRSFMGFTTGEWYRIKVRVSEEKIEAWINEEQKVDLPYAGRRVGIRPEIEASRPFGIATWQTKGAVRNMYVRLL